MKALTLRGSFRGIGTEPVRIKAKGDGNPCTIKPKLSVELLVEKADFRKVYFVSFSSRCRKLLSMFISIFL